jgi:hypothetical protein
MMYPYYKELDVTFGRLHRLGSIVHPKGAPGEIPLDCLNFDDPDILMRQLVHLVDVLRSSPPELAPFPILLSAIAIATRREAWLPIASESCKIIQEMCFLSDDITFRLGPPFGQTVLKVLSCRLNTLLLIPVVDGLRNLLATNRKTVLAMGPVRIYEHLRPFINFKYYPGQLRGGYEYVIDPEGPSPETQFWQIDELVFRAIVNLVRRYWEFLEPRYSNVISYIESKFKEYLRIHPAAQLTVLNLICECLAPGDANFECSYFFSTECMHNIGICLQSELPEVSHCALRALSCLSSESNTPGLVSSIIVSDDMFRGYFPPGDAQPEAFALFCRIWENVIYGINEQSNGAFRAKFEQAKGFLLDAVPEMLPNIRQVMQNGAFEVKIAATMIIAALIQTSNAEILSSVIDALTVPLVLKAFIESLEEHNPVRFQKIAAAIIALLQWAATAGGHARLDIIAELETQGFSNTLEGCTSTFAEPGTAQILHQLAEELAGGPAVAASFL